MNKLKVILNNCYGIQCFDHEFDFSAAPGKDRAYAIYAPNGVMKTSFSRTFEDLSKGNSPKEERYNRASTFVVEADGVPIVKELIYVLKSEIDINSDTPSITNVLVDTKNKARYDELLVDLNKLKNNLIKNLQKLSGLKQAEIEQAIFQDFQQSDFLSCIEKIANIPVDNDLSHYVYNTIFDPKALAILKSKEFLAKAEDFNLRYSELFEQAGSIYQKGIFNPNKADESFGTLNKQGFFAGGHRIHLKGDEASIGKNELDEKIKVLHEKIDGDTDLKKIKDSLTKNVQTKALAELFEELSPTQFEFLLEKLTEENQGKFRRELWAFYMQKTPDFQNYLNAYSGSREEIEAIEANAAKSAPRWNKAVDLFNNRFVGMPFTLTLANQAQAVLGKEIARLKFTFKDGADTVDRSRDEVKLTLSQGEKRALYLLNFIFDVEDRRMDGRETVFILDDIADSFDYKNKHAIVQYLHDLADGNNFHQIILTHNFDFFRAIAKPNGFVHRERCLMTSKSCSAISLTKAEGIQNYFVNIWKPKVTSNYRILFATIPFTRNIIEYTQICDDGNNPNIDYLTLTSLLHWKVNTDQITVGQYLCIYNKVFKTEYDESSVLVVKDLLLLEAQSICAQQAHTGLNLEDKVLLSIAIRLQAEIFLINQIRILTSNDNYWCEKESQFGNLKKKYLSLAPNSGYVSTLEKVGVTVNSNIHLNSFMYEPILDLTIEHLIQLYNEVAALHV